MAIAYLGLYLLSQRLIEGFELLICFLLQLLHFGRELGLEDVDVLLKGRGYFRGISVGVFLRFNLNSQFFYFREYSILEALVVELREAAPLRIQE